MSSLLDHPRLGRPRLGRPSGGRPSGGRPSGARSSDGRAAPLPSPWVAGAIAAVQGAVGALVVVLVPVVATWAVSANGANGSNGSTTWMQVVRLGFAFWLLAQHVGLALTAGSVTIVPLGLAAVPVIAAYLAGRRLGRGLDPNAERIAAGATRAAPATAPWQAAAAMTIGSGAIGVGVALLARSPGLDPVLWQAAVGPAAVGLLGAVLGTTAYASGGLRAAARALLGRLPRIARRWPLPATVALGVHLAGSALLLAGCLVLGAVRVVTLQQALGPGLLGGVVLVLAQLVLLPNLVVWAGAVAAGPGFSVGSGTSVTAAASTLGPLPAVPVLGALPDPGPLPTAALAVLLLPPVAGIVAATVLLRRDRARDRARTGRLALLADVAGLCLLAGLGCAALAWLSGGSAGPGRMAQLGPQPLAVAGAFALEVFGGALLTVLIREVAPSLVDGALDIMSRRERPAGTVTRAGGAVGGSGAGAKGAAGRRPGLRRRNAAAGPAGRRRR